MTALQGRSRWAVLFLSAVLVVSACGSTATSSGSAGASVAAPTEAASAPAASESAAAGASAEPTAVTGASCAAGATEVKFWTSHTPPDSDALANIVNAFNTANPDICVKMTIVPGAETDVAKLLTSIRGGVAPDVYMADRFTVPQRAAEGVLAELPAEVAAMSSQYLPFAWAETQFQGKTYALPFDTDARALWYNKDLITAAGEDPAQARYRQGRPDDRHGRGDGRQGQQEGRQRQLRRHGLDARRPRGRWQPRRLRPGLALHLGLRQRRQVRRPGDVQGDADRIRASSPATSSCTTGRRPTTRRPWPAGSPRTCRQTRRPPRTPSGPASWR